MLNPARVDAAIDLAYGALILVAIALIATVEFGIGIAFVVGVFSAYVLHVVWKMARFDPDWMTSVVEDAVDDAMGDSVERAVDERVATQVDETVGDQLDTVQAQVEAVDDRLDTGSATAEATDEDGSR